MLREPPFRPIALDGAAPGGLRLHAARLNRRLCGGEPGGCDDDHQSDEWSSMRVHAHVRASRYSESIPCSGCFDRLLAVESIQAPGGQTRRGELRPDMPLRP